MLAKRPEISPESRGSRSLEDPFVEPPRLEMLACTSRSCRYSFGRVVDFSDGFSVSNSGRDL
jgi:hypothetical protein